MRSFSSILKSMAFCIVLFVCSGILDFLLYPYSSLNRHFDSYHAMDENIDFLILGNSLENNGINPSLIGRQLNCTAYKFTPQGSYPESLYYILLDVLNKHDVKTVLLGWDIIQNFQNPPYVYPHSEEIYREFLCDFRGNAELAELISKKILEQRYTSTFFKWSSFPENAVEIPAVLKSRREPKAGKNQNQNADETEFSRPQTFRKPKDFEKVVNERKYSAEIQANDEIFLKKISDLCRQKKIKLYVISCTIPESVQSAKPELLECMKRSESLMAELGVTYINASDENVFPGASKDENFSDYFGHFNGWYRNFYTQFIIDFIKKNESVVQ
jgi:hypothetical protein